MVMHFNLAKARKFAVACRYREFAAAARGSSWPDPEEVIDFKRVRSLGYCGQEMLTLRLTESDPQYLQQISPAFGARKYRARSKPKISYGAVKIALGIMPWMPLVPSTTWVT